MTSRDEYGQSNGQSKPSFSTSNPQSLSEAVTSLLVATQKLRVHVEKHKNCVPRSWCDKRIARAVAAAEAREKMWFKIVMVLTGCLTGLLTLFGYLAQGLK